MTTPPTAEVGGWPKDGDVFRHFLDSSQPCSAALELDRRNVDDRCRVLRRARPVLPRAQGQG